MKIRINYDLLEKIKEAKVGFSLQKGVKRVLLNTSISTMLGYILFIPIEKSVLPWIPFYIITHLFYTTLIAKLNISSTKLESIYKLFELSVLLNDINVNTNLDLLSKSYVYKKEYKLELNKNYIPHITQNKYIMVPTYDRGEEKEVSLVQEHVIGSKEYAISHGTPKKVLKLAYNPI